MKRYFTALGCICLAAVLMSGLVSCGGEKAEPVSSISAEEALAAIKENMAKADSYEREVTTEISYYVDGEETTEKISGKQTVIGITSRENVYCMFSGSTKIRTSSGTKKLSSLEAYVDGNYFFYSGDGESESKKYISISADDALKLISKKSFDLSIVEGGRSSKVTDNPDGGVSISFSGYEGERLSAFAVLAGISEHSFISKLKDVKVTVSTDSGFRLLSVNADFVFEEYDNSSRTPCVVFATSFSRYGAAERSSDVPSIEDYEKAESGT